MKPQVKNQVKQIKARKAELVAELDLYKQSYFELKDDIQNFIRYNFETVRIEQGNHRSNDFVFNWIKRKIFFKEKTTVNYVVSLNYFTPQEPEPYQINKLLGVSSLNIHKNSFRLGFKYLDEESYEIYAYRYLDGVRDEIFLCKLKYEKMYFVTLDIAKDDYIHVHIAELYGEHIYYNTHKVNLGKIFFETKPYYGGKYKAPFDMVMTVYRLGSNVQTIKELTVKMVLFYFVMILLASINIWFLIPLFGGFIYQLLKIGKYI